MKPEPLNLEELSEHLADIVFNFYGHGRGEIKTAFKKVITHRIKSACEFFMQYRNNPEFLYNEYELLTEEEKAELERFIERLSESANSYETDCASVINDIMDDYNEWLFKLAFADIFRKEKERDKNDV